MLKSNAPGSGSRSIPERTRTPDIISHGLIFSIMALDVIGITLLFPVSAYIVQQYSDEALLFILLNVSYSVAQFLAAPVLGQLSDRVGRRPVLLACLFGAVVGYLMFGLGNALWILFLSRLIAGITGGSISTASAYLADVAEPSERAKTLGLVGMAWGIGLLVGPVLGGSLGQINLRAPAFAAAALSLINILAGFFLLPESLPKERRKTRPMRASDFNALTSIGDMGRIPGVTMLFIAMCLFNLAFNAMNSTESLFLIRMFSAQPWHLGVVAMLAGLAIAFSQLVLVQRLVPRREQTVCVVSLLLMTVSALAVCFNPVFMLVFPIITLRSGFSNMIFTTLSTLSANQVSSSELGMLMGVTTALGSLMGIIGPVLAGLLYDQFVPGAPYIMAAIIYVIAAYLLNSWKPRKSETVNG